MPQTRIVQNVITGEITEIELTAEEIAELAAMPSTLIVREIDARRLRLALLQLRLLDSVEAGIASLDRAAQIEWDKATVIKDNSPLVVAIVENLGLDVDLIWSTANSIT